VSKPAKMALGCLAALLLPLAAGNAGAAPPPAHKTEAIATASKPMDLTTAPARLAYMRKYLRPYWVAMESGGIFMLPGMEDGKIAAFYQDMMARTPTPAGTPVPDAIYLAGLVSPEIRAFFQEAKLDPGTYRLENYHREYATNGKIPFDSNGDDGTPVPSGQNFDFTVTQEHLKLLRNLNTRDWDAYIEAMDPKRPYGDMTYYFIDMSFALGEPAPPRDAKGNVQFTKEQTDRFEKLHREMLFAVQAFWAYAQ
jgi:hypothetical protein